MMNKGDIMYHTRNAVVGVLTLALAVCQTVGNDVKLKELVVDDQLHVADILVEKSPWTCTWYLYKQPSIEGSFSLSFEWVSEGGETLSGSLGDFKINVSSSRPSPTGKLKKVEVRGDSIDYTTRTNTPHTVRLMEDGTLKGEAFKHNRVRYIKERCFPAGTGAAHDS